MTARRKSWKWRVSDEVLDTVAAEVNEDHKADLAKGLRLTGTSGIWRTKDGALTVRLVYRNADRSFTKTVTVRRLRIAA